jgi:hypothetical protein
MRLKNCCRLFLDLFIQGRAMQNLQDVRIVTMFMVMFMVMLMMLVVMMMVRQMFLLYLFPGWFMMMFRFCSGSCTLKYVAAIPHLS